MRYSAGLLPFRSGAHGLEIFLVHPGGPFWKNKDAGAWSVAKGEYEPPEYPLTAACREFEEETGKKISGTFIPLGDVKQKGGKLVSCWAVKADFDAKETVSNEITIEWPPKSKKFITVPEVDKGQWFPTKEANEKINVSQAEFLKRLLDFTNEHEQGGKAR